MFDQSQKLRRWAIFGWLICGNGIENPKFSEASTTFLHFPGLISHEWHPNVKNAKKYETSVAFSCLPVFFWFFIRFWPKFCVQRMNFQMLFFIIYILARSACSKVIHLTLIEEKFEQYVLHWFLMQNATAIANFCYRYTGKECQKICCLNLCRLLKKIFPVGQAIRVNWVSWRTLDCLGKNLRVF